MILLRSIILICLMCISSTIDAQEQTTLIGQLAYPQGLSGIWGYTHPSGIEYGLVGTQTGLSIVSLADPSQPIEVQFIPGPQSIWREVRTWQDYAYCTTEAGTGLMIVDLTQLPNSAPYRYDTFDGQLNKVHALHIDELGYLYLTGYNNVAGDIPLEDKGILFINLQNDPFFPSVAGAFNDEYVHDVFVQDNIMYTAEIYKGGFGIYDVSDKQNPFLLAFQNTPYYFTHNCWISDNGQYLFTTDEKDGAPLTAYDITDYNDIQLLDMVKVLPGTNTMPHNVFVKDDYLFLSSYTAGVRIFDAANPYNLIEVTAYDTHPATGGGSLGCWGVYPYFDSGLIIASDRSEGLFVIHPVYHRATYLEGIVTDSISNQTIDDVKIQISGQNYYDVTNVIGEYRTGVPNAGIYDISFTRYGYYDKNIPAIALEQGQTNILNTTLQLKPRIDYTININSQNQTINAKATMKDEVFNLLKIGDSYQQIKYPKLVPNDYELIVGQWGNVNIIDTVTIPESPLKQSIEVELEKGYYDDCYFDFYWAVMGDCSSGKWVREIPGTHGSLNGKAPLADVADDIGKYCFMTGNSTNNQNVYLKSGFSTLRSPIMDLSQYNKPELEMRLWFYPQEILPDRRVEIVFDNGIERYILAEFNDSSLIKWRTWDTLRLPLYNYEFSDFSKIYINVFADNDDKIMKLAMDRFIIRDLSSISDPTIEWDDHILLYPNPTSDQLYIQLLDRVGMDGNLDIEIYDITGNKLLEQYIPFKSGEYKIELPNHAGMYIVNFINSDGQAEQYKIIKL